MEDTWHKLFSQVRCLSRHTPNRDETHIDQSSVHISQSMSLLVSKYGYNAFGLPRR